MRAHNKAISKAAELVWSLDDEELHPIAEAILKLQVPYWSREIERLFTRRYELIDKQYYPEWLKLTPEEEEELKELTEQTAALPMGYDVKSQEQTDSIRSAAELLKRHL